LLSQIIYRSAFRRFLRSGFDCGELLSHDLLLCFSDRLERDAPLQDWQRRQAVKAAELYLQVYLPAVSGEWRAASDGEGLKKNVDATPSSRFPMSGNSERGEGVASATSAKQVALREMKALLKLQNPLRSAPMRCGVGQPSGKPA